MFEFNSNNTKKILLIITYTAILCAAIFNISSVMNAIGYVLGLFKPFIIGFCLAFIFNIPRSKVESFLLRLRAEIKSKGGKRKIKNPNKKVLWIRMVSILISMLIFAGIIALVLLLVIPEFINTISMFKDSIPSAFNHAKEWIEITLQNYPNIVAKVKAFSPDWNEVTTNVTEFAKNAATGFIGFSFDFVKGVFSGVVSFVIGIFFAVYMLSQKETLQAQLKRVISAYFPEKAKGIFEIGRLTSDTFKKFFAGQFFEAILLGTLTFIGMTVFKMPYALTIAVLIGVTALIPVFGALIGTLISAILILAVNPMQAVWFVVFIVILQQIDNNLIYPRVVGNSVGLPGIWVLLAVLVGGNGFGVIGMLVAVPLASIIYTLVGRYVDSKHKRVIEKE